MRLDEAPLPQAASDLHAVDIDGEHVIYDARSGRLHTLNTTASVIWSCLDGKITLRELVDELAEGFGVDEREVREGVVSVLRHLADEGLVEGSQPPEREPRRSGAELEPPCVPCSRKVAVEPFARNTELDIDGLQVIVQTNTAAAASFLEELFGDTALRVVSEPAHYSVVVASVAGDGPRDLHRLQYSSRLVVRTRSEARLWRGLVRHLEAHLDVHRTGAAVVSARLAVRGDDAVLLATDARLGSVEARLFRRGIVVVDTPSVTIEPAGTVRLDAPSLPVNAAALERLPDHRGPELPQPASGRWRLRGWLARGGTPRADPLEPVDARGQVLRAIRNIDAAGPDVVTQALAAVADARVHVIDDRDADRFATQIEDALSRRG